MLGTQAKGPAPLSASPFLPYDMLPYIALPYIASLLYHTRLPALSASHIDVSRTALPTRSRHVQIHHEDVWLQFFHQAQASTRQNSSVGVLFDTCS
jgi:hypothetical protein